MVVRVGVVLAGFTAKIINEQFDFQVQIEPY